GVPSPCPGLPGFLLLLADPQIDGRPCAPMLLEFAHSYGFELKNCSRVCAATARPLSPGEVYFSVLTAAGHDFERHDYSVEAWHGPPDPCLGWWRSRIPTK